MIEQHSFRLNKSEPQNIEALFNFMMLYEKEIRTGGNGMNQAIIDTAVSVGKSIGMNIADYEKENNRKGKCRGDLFRLSVECHN